MADDEDDAGVRPTPEELLSPAGPRRSNFTPAPADAESLEAANNVFNDDAIAAALAAELARVASGPIPVQQVPASPLAASPAVAPSSAASEPESPAAPAQAAPVQATAAEPAVPSVPAAPPAPPIPSAPAVSNVPSEPAAPVAPTQPEPAAAAPQAPLGPPDWASPLFGQPTTPRAEPTPAEMLNDPFAPNAPSFAPATGSFPPPTAYQSSEEVGGSAAADPDTLRELYRGAPAPTVPAADAPPPPGYEPPTSVSIDEQPSATLNAIEQLQAQLHLREQEAQEFASWESAMQAIGTPEALAEVARARAELAGAESTPAGPPAEEPVADLAPPADEPAPSFAAPTDEPAFTLAPPVDDPFASPAPPAEEPLVNLAPPADEPLVDLAPPADEPLIDVPPPAGESPVSLAPPADEPLTDLAPPTAEAPVGLAPPAADPFAAFPPPDVVMPPASPVAPPPPTGDNPFAAFGAAAGDAQPDTFSAPADPRDLSFDPLPLPDAPTFLEPPALVEPPPADGVEALYRAAEASADPVPSPPTADAGVPSVGPPPAAPADLPAPTGTAPTGPQGFDDLLVGSGAPNPPAESSAWIAPDAAAAPDPAADQPADRRPFGEGVDSADAVDPQPTSFETALDEAVDPSDSIFGAPRGPVSVNTAGVAMIPEAVSLESRPIRVIPETADGTPEPIESHEPMASHGPTISPPEPVGLEPTPTEQRVGRSARLFWIWFAANSSIVAVVLGTIIFALGVSLRQAIVATLAGVAISFIPLGLGTLAGKRSGQPTMVISRATFGLVGNILPALIALLSRLFWAAALLWILGESTAEILVGAQLTDGFTGIQLTIAAMAIYFVFAVVIAFFGYALIAVVQLIVAVTSAIAIVGFIALTAKYIDLGTALATGDGSWILVVTGAVLVFSFVGLAWANSGADVARYQRSGSSGGAAMLWATFGAGLPAFVLIGYGALLAASNHTLARNIAANPLDSLARLLPVWYPAPLLLATGLSLLSGVVLAMYSGGFALQAAGLRTRRSLSTLLVGVLAIVIALFIALSVTNLDQLVRDVATTVAVPIAAWAGIFGAEVMIRKRPLDSAALLARGGIYPNVRWGNLIGLVGVTAIGYAFLSATMSGLTWEGYGFTALGIPITGQVATSDFGVLVALLLGILVGAGAGTPGIRRQEKAGLPAE